MTVRVLIIGGYGNFGKFIAKKLAMEETIQLIIAGRDLAKATQCVDTLHAAQNAEAMVLDINRGLAEALAKVKPDIVIHTSGPFQKQSYHVAEACIEQGCHYIDLADGREFVTGIPVLDSNAKVKQVLVCSGASSVPCLTAAVIDHYKPQFKQLETIDYAIATAQLTNRGLATTSAVLSYAGKAFDTLINGKMQSIYGWLNVTHRRFWQLGSRLMANCDIPDLRLFPTRYPELKTIRFHASLELKLFQLTLAGLSWLVRLKLIPSLQPFAAWLLKFSFLFDGFGKDNSGFYMVLSGTGKDGEPKQLTFELVAKHGDGIYIPTIPAILLAKKLARGELTATGATACVDLVTLDEYLEALHGLAIEWRDTP